MGRSLLSPGAGSSLHAALDQTLQRGFLHVSVPPGHLPPGWHLLHTCLQSCSLRSNIPLSDYFCPGLFPQTVQLSPGTAYPQSISALPQNLGFPQQASKLIVCPTATPPPGGPLLPTALIIPTLMVSSCSSTHTTETFPRAFPHAGDPKTPTPLPLLTQRLPGQSCFCFATSPPSSIPPKLHTTHDGAGVWGGMPGSKGEALKG